MDTRRRLDTLAADALGRALYLEMFDGQERPNAARFFFLDRRARDFCLGWDRIARDVVAIARLGSLAATSAAERTSPTG